jgi:hypothetical protein
MRTLHIVMRDAGGQVSHQAIGRAIVAAAIDEKVTRSTLRTGLLALAFYQSHSPRQAAEAMRTLAELGDVDFEERDFDPQWCSPDQCIRTIDVLLGRKGRPFSESVRAELVQIRQALAEASGGDCTFYLVELGPGERLAAHDVGPAQHRGSVASKRNRTGAISRPANQRLHPTAAGTDARGRG